MEIIMDVAVFPLIQEQPTSAFCWCVSCTSGSNLFEHEFVNIPNNMELLGGIRMYVCIHTG